MMKDSIVEDAWIERMLAKYPIAALKDKEGNPTGNFITCPVRLAWTVGLFEPKAQPRDDGSPGDLKYSCTLLFPRQADLTLLKAASHERAVEKWGADYAKKVKVHTPFGDGQSNELLAGYEAGCVYINVNNKNKPEVVMPDGITAITSVALLYSGVWARVTIRPYAYDVPKRKGVAFGLQNVQKVADDKPFGGVAPKASDEFKPIDEANESVASIF